MKNRHRVAVHLAAVLAAASGALLYAGPSLANRRSGARASFAPSNVMSMLPMPNGSLPVSFLEPEGA